MKGWTEADAKELRVCSRRIAGMKESIALKKRLVDAYPGSIAELEERARNLRARLPAEEEELLNLTARLRFVERQVSALEHRRQLARNVEKGEAELGKLRGELRKEERRAKD